MKKNSTLNKIGMLALLCLAVLLLCMGVGSVPIPLNEMFSILIHKIGGRQLSDSVDPSLVSILWTIRIPRALTAFLVGGMLSVSGAVMQSVLQNPLASSYTLGVSSGASLGAAIIITGGISTTILGPFLLPFFGFAFGLGTVILVLRISTKFDRNVTSHTVILFGMVVSLFTNALLTLLSALNSEHSQKLILWQMGSFSGKRWYHVWVLLPCGLVGLLLLLHFHRELDIMTFGDEQAMSVGIDLRSVKRRTMGIAAFLTGVAVCFTGTIGFVDLIVPHLVRKIFGASSRYVLLVSMLLGGAFLALADLIARTVLSPREIPVGAVTALIGAPFFVWVYFGGGRKGSRHRT